MSVIIPAAFVLSIFFLTAWTIFGGLINATEDQTESLRIANQLYEERLRTRIDITGTTTSGDGYAMTVLNDSKSVSFGDFSEIDLFAHYTDSTGGTRVQRLTHSTDWSVSKISGDAANPGFWDPGETATITFSVTPNLQACTQGTAVITVPGGVADATYFGASPLCLFWHNDPTPPVGDTASHTELSMDGTEPTGETLYNYDTDRDSATG